jgi:hypothetical protein
LVVVFEARAVVTELAGTVAVPFSVPAVAVGELAAALVGLVAFVELVGPPVLGAALACGVLLAPLAPPQPTTARVMATVAIKVSFLMTGRA